MRDKITTSLLNLIKVKSILTFIAGFVFIYMVVNNKIEEATTTAILMLVFQSLFDRSKNKGDE